MKKHQQKIMTNVPPNDQVKKKSIPIFYLKEERMNNILSAIKQCSN